MASNSDPALKINQLPVSIEIPAGEPLQDILSLIYKRLARAVNTKEGSLFDLYERGNFQQYYTVGQPFVYRNVYRMVFDMVDLNGGSIAPGATVAFAHGITGITQTTDIYGSATNSTPRYLPLPYVSATTLTNQIEIYLTATQVVLVNGATQSALTSASIVAEYVKQ